MKTLLTASFIVSLFALGCNNNRTASKTNSNSNQTLDTLGKKDNETITNKYWKLITLEGKEVIMAKNQEREAYFILKSEQKTITGFSGCNTFNGTYSLENGWRIRFSKMASTLKACPDVEVNESEFLNVFELADNFSLSGDTLSLNVGRRAPLAVFKAVYFN